MSDGNGNGDLATTEALLISKEDGVTELRAVPLEGTSTQPDDTSLLWTPDDTIAPPEDLISLRALSENSWIRGTCIEAVARNTVGLGWEIVADTDGSQIDPDELIADAKVLDALAERDKRLDSPTFGELMYAVKTEEEECGNGYVEISRKRGSGQIDGLFHVPGPYVRRKKDRSGYVVGMNPQIAGADTTRVDYYNFGEKAEYGKDGKPTGRLQAGKRWAVNELLPFRLFTSASRDYGLPRDVELAIEYLAAKLVDEWGVGFFDSSGVPPTILFVSGEESKTGQRIRFTVPQETIERIDQALKTDASRVARVAVVPVPPGTNVQAESLATLSERDLTFGDFKKQHRRNVGGSFRLSPIFYGDVDDAGRYTAEVQRALTLEQVFDPEQDRYESRLTRTLMRDLGMEGKTIRFKRLAVEGDAVRRESANDAAEVGAITIGEYRNAHGLGPLPFDGNGDDPNDAIINAGKPRGAEDRTNAAQDQRGLRPGIGGRVAKHDDGHGEPYVDAEVDQLVTELVEASSGAE